MPWSQSLVPNMLSNTDDVTGSGGIASASNEYDASHQAWCAFDGLISTYWRSTATVASLTYQFPTARVVTNYTMAFRSDHATHPKDWQLLGSNNGSTWTTLDTQTNQTQTVTLGRYTFSFSNATAYTYYRLIVTAVNSGGTYVSLNNLLLAGPTPSGDCLRVCDYYGSAYTDLVSTTNPGFGDDITVTKVLNEPGSLTFSVRGVTYLSNPLSSQALVEVWLEGVRVGNYIIDDMTHRWDEGVIDASCVGVLSYASRKTITSSRTTASPLTQANILGIVNTYINATGIVPIPLIWYSADKVSFSGLNCAWNWTDLSCLTALQDICAQDHDAFWVDADYYLNIAPLSMTPVEITDAASGNVTTSSRDIITQVIVKGSSTWTINNDEDQALYGVFTAVITDSSITTADLASAAANRVLRSPAVECTALVAHSSFSSPDVYPGSFVSLYNADAMVDGTCHQVTYRLGELFDEITLGSQPLTLA